MSDPPIQHSSLTEDTPATPAWIETELDDLLAPLAAAGLAAPVLATLRSAYLDCLAGSGGPADVEAEHDRCRQRFLAELRAEEIGGGLVDDVAQRLAALEAELTART